MSSIKLLYQFLIIESHAHPVSTSNHFVINSFSLTISSTKIFSQCAIEWQKPQHSMENCVSISQTTGSKNVWVVTKWHLTLATILLLFSRPGAPGRELLMGFNRLVSSSEGLKMECNFLIGQYCCRVVLAFGNPQALGKVTKSLVYYWRLLLTVIIKKYYEIDIKLEN